jgi:hypothetical protein
VFARDEGEEPMQPGDEQRSGRPCLQGHGGLADRVHLVGVERLEELAAAREIAIEGRHPHAGASRDLGHRYLRIGIGESGSRGSEDLLAVALGVCASRP